MGAGIRTTSRARDAGTVDRASAAGTAGRPDGPRLARPRVLLATLLAAGALAACSAGPGPDSPTSPPASPGSVVTIPRTPATAGDTTPTSGTPTGYDVLANMPAAAKEHTNAGAKAFARYYIEAYGRLLMDPAKGQLPKLELSQCTGCHKRERILGENVDAGRRWADVYFRTVSVGEPDVNGEAIDASTVADIHLFSVLTNSPVVVQEPNGVATTRPKSSDVIAQFWLTWRDQQWYVRQFENADYTRPTK